MNRIQSLLQQKRRSVLSFYCTAGFPRLEDTLPVLEALETAGADMIEIGMPFSDPLADGPVIQQSSTQALQNGMNLPVLFDQLKAVRNKVKVPLLLMGYLNPVLQFGIARFCKEAAACGIDGLIIPDLPLDEYREAWEALTRQHNLSMVFLVTPATPEARIHEIDRLSHGFIYVVTAAATTGKDLVLDKSTQDYFSRLQQLSLRNPLIAGFGIRDKQGFDQVCRYVNGAVVGSGLIRALQQDSSTPETVAGYVKSFTGAQRT
jgi:tryptophan synthase alpha chain